MGEELLLVKVESILSVVSSKPIEPGKVHKLSLLDQAMGLHTVHLVFYYASNPFNEGPMSSDIDNLRVSLSHLLNQYPNATGRLTRDPDGGWQVKCNDAGVRILQASVTATLDEWLRSADAVLERDLTVWEDMPQDPSFWSPFRIQINNFKCGGLAIGLSCSHMNADITSLTLLIKSWTEAHRGQPLTHTPTFQLHLPTTYVSSSSSLTPSPLFIASNHVKMGTVTMKFSDSSIRKYLSQVKNECPKATPFDVLVALFWSRIAKWVDPSPKHHYLSLCVDMRTNPGIPYGYFGNALHFSLLSMDADMLLSDTGHHQVSDCIHKHVSSLKEEDFGAFIRELESKEQPCRMYGPRLTCINAEHLVCAENGGGLMYAARFNEEKPVLVSYNVGNVEGEGLIMVMPSSEAGFGRTVTVTLPEEQIVNLCKDKTVLGLEPIMLVSGNRR
ncbi:hypothetical protein ACJIZ3_015952 [Penstemon smallii]|uniref:Uncharacterized protein n=1 Tax=Penstemon smallii TaxID=265156 RepID=A0ABD3RNZ5_9LAMI